MRTGLLRKILWLLMVCALLCGAQAMAEEGYQDHAELLRDGYLPQKQPMDIVVLRGETFEEFMLAKIEARETVFSIEAYQLTADRLQLAMTDLLDKHPELFYVSNEWLNWENADGVVTEIEISYLYTDEVTAEKKAAFDASVNTIVSHASQADTTLGKVMMVHDYLCVNYEYDESLAIHSAEEMFRTGKGVCQAYLQCFQAVMNALGIECEPVTSLSMAHGWNAVKVNGNWYHLDATWDDPIGNMPLSARHNNFLLSDAGMRANGHYDWTSAVTASSTTYDSFFWSGVNTAIPVVDDVMYYVDAETAAAERTVKAWNMSAGTTADVHTYLISAVDGSAFYVSGYNPIAAGENNLYYMTIDRVYAMPLEGGVPVLMHTTTGTDYIWASWLTGSQLKVYAAETPGESGKIITLDALDVAPLPFSYADNGDGTATITGYTGTDAEVVIPAQLDGLQVTGIANFVFSSKSFITSVEIPEGIKSIGDAAFDGCSLQTIDLPDTLTRLGSWAFFFNDELTEVHLPASLTEIGRNPFGGSGVTKFTVDEANPAFKTDGKVVYSIDGSVLKFCAADIEGVFAVPEGVTAIEDEAFSAVAGLTEVIMPSTLESIGEYAFSEAFALAKVTLNSDLRKIGRIAFINCSSLEGLELPDEISEIGENAFGADLTPDFTLYVNAGTTTEKTLADAGWEYETIMPVYEYIGLDDGTCIIIGYNGEGGAVSIPETLDGLTVIAVSDNAFGYCEDVTQIHLPASVTGIAGNAFMPYCGVQAFTVDDGNEAYAAVDGVLFDKSMSSILCYPARKADTEYTVPESVNAIGENAFYQNYELETVVLPEGVKTIGACAFEDCPALKEINLPKGITGIGENAFAGCINLTASVTENSYAHTWCVENGVDCELKSMSGVCGDYHYVDNGDGTATITQYTGVRSFVEVPFKLDELTVTGIADNAFAYCEYITWIDLPSTVNSIASGAFMPYCSVHGISVGGGNNFYAATEDGVLFDKAMSTVVCYPSRKSGAEYIVPESVTAIGENAFYQNYELETVVLPEGVETVGDCAFEDCPALEEINLPESITHIGENAFAGCINLTALVTEDSYAHIWCVENGIDCRLDVSSDYLYADHGDGTATITEYIGAASDVEVPSKLNGLSVTGIGPGAFRSNSSITSVTLPEGLLSIGNAAFQSCGNLQTIHFPEGLVSIGDLAFNVCNLTEITLPSSLTSIGDSAFLSSGSFTTLTVPATLTDIGPSAFAKCNMTSAVLEEGLTAVTERMFDGCRGLTDVTIPGTVTTIDSYAFNNCIALNRFSIPESVTVIGEGAFQNCTSLPIHFTLPEGVESVGSYAFRLCTGLSDFTAPESLTSIGRAAFQECTTLMLVDLGGVTQIPDCLFDGCTNLRMASFTNCLDGITDIGSYAFRNCENLSGVTFDDTLSTIGDGAFQGCKELAVFYLPNKVKSVGSNAFEATADLWCKAATTTAATLRAAGYTYRTEYTYTDHGDGTCTIVGYHGNDRAVNIPSEVCGLTVTGIDSGAFAYCEDVTQIRLPATVSSIGSDAFMPYCGVQAFTVDDGNEAYAAADGVLFDKAMSTVVCYPARKADAEYTVPESVTAIGENAFYQNYELETVVLQDGVKTIGACAFEDCPALKEINLPKGITGIGEYAFAGCINLTAYVTENSYAHTWCLENGVDCELKSMSGVSGNYRYVDNSDGTATITEYTGTSGSVEVPAELDGLTVTGIADNAFGYCEYITQIRLPATVSSIASGAFMPYCGVQAFTVDDGNEDYAAADGVLFDKAMSTVVCYPSRKADAEYTVPESVTAIGENAFYQNYELETVVLPEGIKTIGACAFEDCPALKEINLPKGITGIGEYAFAGCINLTAHVIENSYAHTWCVENGVDYELISMGGVSGNYRYVDNGDGTCTITDYTGTAAKVTIPSKLDDLQVTGIGEEAFANVDEYGYVINNTTLTTVVIPKGVTWIGDNAFALCSALSKVTLPETLVSIGTAAFEGCDLYTLTLPDSIATISDWAFSGNGRLTKVDLPASLSELGALAFGSCWEMDQLTIEESNTVYKAENNVLYTKDGTKLVLYAPGLAGAYEVPEGVTEIETRAFSAAIGLTEVKLPSTLRVIGDSAFNATRKLKSINLPEGLETIGTAAFNGSGIESIQIPDGITEIPANAFLNCRSLKTVSLPSSITSIGKQAFNRCELLEALKLPDHISEIGADAFGWSGTADFPLYVNEGTTTEETLAAAGWDYEAIPIPFEYSTLDDGTCAITGYIGTESTVVIPAQIKGCRVSAIAEKAFFGDSTMVHVTIEEGIQTIGAQAFFHSSIESVSVPSSVTAIGSRAFFAANLAQITIAEANPVYQSINGVVFDKAGTTLLIYPIGSTQETYSVPDTVAKIGDFAFDGADHLKSIGFSCTSRLEEIGEYAIAYLNIESIVLPPNLCTIQEFAFYKNQEMDAVYFLGRAPEIEDASSFGECGEGTLTLYYCEGKAGWQPGWNGYHTAVFDSPDTAHSEVVIEEACAATCTETGLTEGKYCSDCGEVFSVQEVIAVKDHEPVRENSIPAVKDEDGLKAIVCCSMCGEVYEEEETVLHSKTLFMPAALKEVQAEAFMGSAMQQITIPDGVTSIGSKAFAECPELIMAVIPDSVEEIADDAFEGSDQVLLLCGSEDSYAAQWAERNEVEAEILK